MDRNNVTSEWSDGWFCITAGAVAIVAGIVVSLWPTMVLAALLATVAIGLALSLRRRLSPVLLSPVGLAVGALVLLATLGGALYGHVAVEGSAGVSARLELTVEDTARTTRLLLVAAMSVAAGAALVAWLLPARSDRPRRQPVTLSGRVQGWVLVGVALLLVTIVTSYGWQALLQRSVYLQVARGSATAVGIELSMGVVVCLGALATGLHRHLAFILAGCYFTLYFALGSRRLALFPLLFVLGILSVAPRMRSRWLLLAAAALVGFFLLRVPLGTRAMASHGLLPYLTNLPTILSAPSDWNAFALNLLFGFGAIGETSFSAPPIPAHDFWVAINPLPGGLAGWYDIAAQHRINEFTPFAGIGELGNHGWQYLVGYCLAVGMVFAWWDARMRALLAAGKQLYGLALVGLAGLFMLVLTQYNLRSATRVLYYAITLALALGVLVRTQAEEPPITAG
jgi:hypothetical protein